RGAAGESPAVAKLVGAEGTRVDWAELGAAGNDAYLALLAGAVTAAGRIDRDAVPARGVEERRPGRDACLLDRPVLADLQVAEADALGMRLLRKILDGAHVAAACFARWRRIHSAPHSSWPMRKSVARTASTVSSRRASMIALVSPWLCATARNAAPSVWRPGRPNDVLDAPQVVFTPSSSRSRWSVSTKSVTARGSAPTGMASGSMITSS